MADTESERSRRGEHRVNVHERDGRGNPTAMLGTATIISPNAVILDFPIQRLPIRIGITAPPEVVQDTKAGRLLDDGNYAFDVATIHLGTADILDVPGAPDVLPQGERHAVALEIASAALLPSPRVRHSARSFWCILFPHLQACIPRR